jgi:hypothetical protein
VAHLYVHHLVSATLPNLVLRGRRACVVDEALTLIVNDLSDSITNIFSGLAENDEISLAGVLYRVTYQHDGDGTANDFALVTLQNT